MHTAVQRSTSPRRILIADDEPHIRRILQTVLESAGFEVDLRQDGTDALAAVQGGEHYDLILLDIMMPVMDGYEAMQRIRRQKKHVDLPIIALTANALPGDRERCLDAGMDDYLSKPVNRKQLQSTLAHWQAQPQHVA